MAASCSGEASLELLPLAASVGQLPEPLQGCVYDVSARAWIPPAAISSQPAARHCCFLWGFTHQVEKARKAAACKRCGEIVEKAAVRVGYPAKGGKGGFGVAVVWFHAACGRRDEALVSAARGGDRVLRERLLGYDALRKEERLQLRDELARAVGEEERRAEERRFEPPAPLPVRRLEPHAAPAALVGSLLPFQQEGLGWMLAREADEATRGGVLADEMGMGKTMQALALVLMDNARGPTLVVCPAAAMLQWRNEILRFSKPGFLNVVLHHGVMCYDPEVCSTPRTVVLTTYGTVEADYRREVRKTAVPCEWCHRLIVPKKLKAHQKYHCGPAAAERAQGPRRAGRPGAARRLTLGGVETFVELNTSTNSGGQAAEPPPRPPPQGELPPGRKRLRRLAAAAEEPPAPAPPPPPAPAVAPPPPPAPAVPEVPTGEVRLPPRPPRDVEDRECEVDLSQAPLFRERWGRVVLDEAHRIKGRTNSTAQAMFELRVRKSGARWCLSGTPLQNRVGELWSLLRFLRFYPYAYYFCSKRDCSCFMLRHTFDPDTSRCRKCGHTKMRHQSLFNADVANPIKRFGFLGAGKVAMEKLRGEVLDKILLRRTKVERKDDIQLPPLKVKIRRCELNPEERDVYKATYTKSKTQFDAYVAKGTVLHNYAHIFDLILKLRQAADHPYLITHRSLRSLAGPAPSAEPVLADAPDEPEGESTGDACTLCHEDVDVHAARMAQCGHVFHRRCLAEYLEEAPRLASGFAGCPACFDPLDEDDASAESSGGEEPPAKAARRGREPAAEAVEEVEPPLEFRTSSKIEALVEELKRMLSKRETSKALVFSQFVRFLELIEWRLRREGLRAVMFQGKLPSKVRNSIVLTFQNDPSLKILLISLRAGAEGLNLQAADRVFLMDPWWNPASELQAIQRAHRIGQTRRVLVTRFVAADTIEERIIDLQEKKQSVFDCTIGGSNQALQRLTAHDIEFLFSGAR